MPEERNVIWLWVGRLFQILTPVGFLWLTWITNQQYQDIAHRDTPHANEPVEKDAFHELETKLTNIAKDIEYLKVGQGELKKGLTIN